LNRTGNRRIHGLTRVVMPDGSYRKTPEYETWSGLKQRCYNKNARDYERYGGRGITVCDRWAGKDGFLNFISDMGNRPAPEYTIDREDNDGPYSPDNCRWATKPVQNNNKSNTILLTVEGETMGISEWISRVYPSASSQNKTRTLYKKIYERVRLGWSHKDCVFGKKGPR